MNEVCRSLDIAINLRVFFNFHEHSLGTLLNQTLSLRRETWTELVAAARVCARARATHLALESKCDAVINTKVHIT